MLNKFIVFFALFLFICVSLCFPQTADTPTLKWFDTKDFSIAGKGWTDTKTVYDRLPAKAEKAVRPPVWNLSQNSAGLSVEFVTDSEEIYARWTLRNQTLSLGNMVSTSHSGVDLYVKEGTKWRWAGAGRPSKVASNEAKLVSNMSRQERRFRLYLPLYNGIESLEIGVKDEAKFVKGEENNGAKKPIVFYGTSIVQGASASRAGLDYPSILGRRLDYPTINLGFSGNCKMEKEMIELLTELNPSVYFIDCLPNIGSGEEVEAKTPDLVKTLRQKHPNTPIILVENILYPDIFIDQKKRQIVEGKNKSFLKVYNDLQKSGVKNLYYIPAQNLIGTDGEATIDGTHPTDVGFERMANAFEPILRKVLRK